jgi:uncharacterized protein with HEPN domain
MYRLRNRVANEYFGIDYFILWDIVKNYLPGNKKTMEGIITKIRSESTE